MARYFAVATFKVFLSMCPLGTQWHVQTSSFWFTIKHMFHKHPVLFSALSFGATWLCTALVVQFLEHAINADIDSVSEALWLTVLTMVRHNGWQFDAMRYFELGNGGAR